MAVAEPAGFTDDEAREIWRLFRDRQCDHCGGGHARACPRIKRLEFHPNTALAAVEFWPDGKWPIEHVSWPEDLPPEPGSDTL